MKSLLISALALLATTVTAFACPSSPMLDAVQPEVTIQTNDNRYNLYMSADATTSKVFVVAENRKTCRVKSDFMTPKKIWDTYGISYEEALEVQSGDNEGM